MVETSTSELINSPRKQQCHLRYHMGMYVELPSQIYCEFHLRAKNVLRLSSLGSANRSQASIQNPAVSLVLRHPDPKWIGHSRGREGGGGKLRLPGEALTVSSRAWSFRFLNVAESPPSNRNDVELRRTGHRSETGPGPGPSSPPPRYGRTDSHASHPHPQ